MRVMTGQLKRCVACCAIAVGVLALFGVGTAAAAVTKSDITSVSEAGTPFGNPLFYTWNNDLGGYQAGSANQPMMTISGTSDGTTGDEVDIGCVYDYDGETYGYSKLATSVPVNADGSFSTTVGLPNEDAACRLAAVPAGSSVDGIDASPFQGPVLAASYEQTSQDAAGNTYDYDNDMAQLQVFNQIKSASDGGLCTSYLTGATELTNYSGYKAWGNYDDYDPSTAPCTGVGALYGDDGVSRSEIQVDGRNGYLSYWAATGGTGKTSSALYKGSEGPSARADLTLSRDQTATDGDTTIVESENIVECQANPDPYPATSSNCGGTKASGLRLQRTITTSDDGQQVTISDKYSSVDGAQHALDVEYDNNTDQYYQYDNLFQFPEDSAPHLYLAGDSPSLGSDSTGTIYTQGYYADYYGDTDEYSVPAAVTYTTQPTSARFITQPVNSPYPYCYETGYYGACDFLLDYQRTVPAGGSVTITQVYTVAESMAQVQALAQMTEDASVSPTVTITTPANGSTVSSPQVTAIGTATDLQGLKSLRIDGVPVTTDASGNWSLPLTLAPGNNTITAVATNLAGNTAQAQDTVVYAPPGQPLPKCDVPDLLALSLKHATQELVSNNCALGKVKVKFTKAVQAGRVDSQSLAGNGYPYGTKVNLYIAQKPKKKDKHAKHSKKAKKHLKRNQHRTARPRASVKREHRR
jgi:Glucodextranase, domain B